MNTAAKGRRNEHRSMALFEAMGYETLRSAASKTRWDFIAWNAHETYFVQVRTGRWPSPAEMEDFKQAMIPPRSSKIIHRWEQGQRLPLVKTVYDFRIGD